MDRQRAGEFARTARLGSAQAEQSEHIDRQQIGVEIHALAGLISARVGISMDSAFVAHVPQQMPTGVLRDGRAEMHAETPVQEVAFGVDWFITPDIAVNVSTRLIWAGLPWDAYDGHQSDDDVDRGEIFDPWVLAGGSRGGSETGVMFTWQF